MKGQTLIDYLSGLAGRSPGSIAALGRSISFAPGTYAPAYPALEPLVGTLDERERERAYLIAGLWARYGKNAAGVKHSLATAFRQMSRHSDSVVSRFTTLLDADADELGHRLRQAVALAAGAGLSIDWGTLYDDLNWWTHPDKYVQQRWARAFFQNGSVATGDASASEPTLQG